MPTIPPFDAEYAAWPIWPSKAATDATLTMAALARLSGSTVLIAVPAMRMQSKLPIRLIAMTFLKASRLAADS